MGLREVEEIDEFGNVRKVLREVEEEGIKKAPKTRDLKEKIIVDKYGRKKKFLVDDEGNVVDEDDVVYEDEEYIDEFGNKRTRKVAKIKKDAMKRMQEKEKEDEEEGIKKAPKTRNLQEKTIIDKYGNKVKVLIDDQGNVVDEKDIVYEDEEYIDEFGNVRKVLKEVEEEGIKKSSKNKRFK